MVKPVKGPVVTEGGRGSQNFWYTRSSMTQAKPFNLRLPFYYAQEKLRTFTPFGDPNTTDPATLPLGWAVPGMSVAQSVARNQAHGLAFRKLVGKLGDTASLGITIAQRQKSVDMIASHVQTMAKAFDPYRRYPSLKTLRRREAAMTDLDRQNRLRRRLKKPTSVYLEAHFGWEPLIKDIYSAVMVLQSPIPNLVAKAGGRAKYAVGNPATPSDLGESYRTFNTARGNVGCSLIADISVTNPLLMRANQLGLVNPAVVVWDGVPWSFVIDWFVNVSDFLSGFTAFSGVTLIEPATTYYTDCERTRVRTGANRLQSPEYSTWDTLEVWRYEGISGPNLHVRPPKPLSVTRGITSIALLIQKIRTVK